MKAIFDGTILASNVFTVIEPEVELTAQKSLLTLKHDKNCNLQVNVQPPGVTVTDYRIEMKRVSEGTWYTLTNAQSLSPWSAKIAGDFHLRGMAKAGGTEYFSSNVAVTVQFPEYSQIAGDSAVQSATDSEWTNTKNDCTEDPNRRRERGFWVALNTANDTYEPGSTVTGEWAGAETNATIDIGARPADVPSSPAPNSTGATYSVASFHTHTPTTYLSTNDWRLVGASTPDNDFNTYYDITGIVYDYVGDENGGIWGGHPKDSAAQRSQSGPTRRTTP